MVFQKIVPVHGIELWKPKSNFFSATQVQGLEKSHLMFKPKNKEVILILASVILDQPCSKMDFANFPFDTQMCAIATGGLRVRSSEVLNIKGQG